MNRFLHIIVNQQSRNSSKHLKVLLLELPRYTNQYKIHQTKSLEQLESLIELLKSSINKDDVIVFVGGDGSMNQGISLLEKYDVQNIIGYIPSGSGNDFARAHNLSNNIKESLAHFFTVKEPRELSIIQASEGPTEYYAVNSLGIGIDGLVNQRIIEQKKDKGSGSLTYLASAVSAFKDLRSFPLTLKVDGGVFQFDKAQIALIVNNPYFGGGLKIIPEARSNDDVLEVLIAENVTFKDLLSVLSRLMFNQSHLNNKKLTVFKTKSLALYTEAYQQAQKDGEPFEQEGYALTFKTKKRLFWL